MQNNRILLKSLKRITPSGFTAITKCAYRVVLTNSCSGPLLPYSPASHLGNVIHECIRLIFTNEIKTENQFDDKWNRLVSKEEEDLKDMGFGFYTPLSVNVSGFTIKKLQVKSLIRREYGNAVSKQNRKTMTNILTEKWLEAKDKMIGGYADIIFTSNGHTKLSDFKSGKIIKEDGDIKEEYEDQLKLYAYLHKETFGNYPDQLSIIDLDKKEYSIAFTPEECESLAVKSKEILLETNLLIEEEEYEKLANPDHQNCKSCLYRPTCDYYWKLPLLEIDNSIFRDIRGVILDIKQFGNGNLNATLNQNNMQLTICHIGSEHKTFLSQAIGKKIAFYNVRQGEISGIYNAIKTTKVYEA